MKLQYTTRALLLQAILTASALAYNQHAAAEEPVSAEDAALSAVVVNSGSAKTQSILRQDIIATESFSARDIEKSGGSMLTEVVDKRPGVSVQNECSLCNSRNILLNNLPGRFTTVLIDGIPIFSSVSAAYGLDSVSLGGLERIDVSRGAGASLIAPEALSGAVNLITRRPLENEVKLNQQFGSYHQRQTDAFAARVFSGGAATVNFSTNTHGGVDGDGNGVTEFSRFDRNLGGIGLFADDIGGFKIKSRLDFVEEKRMGGPYGSSYSSAKASLDGNPYDWSSGPHGSPYADGWVIPDTGLKSTYNQGKAGMSEIIFTNRAQFIGSGSRKLGDGTLRVAFGYANHKQDSFYEKTVYKSDQSQYYLEASTQQPIESGYVTAGVNYRYEDLTSTGRNSSGVANNGIDNYLYQTPGVFLQVYRAFLDNRLEANGSVRIDKHNEFGVITSPRLNLLWTHDDPQLNSRFSVGKGYRAPTSFFEQDHGILDTTKIVRQVTKPEISHNASYVLSYASDRFAFSGGFNWNKIYNVALLDSGAVDTGGNSVTLFTSADRPITVKGADVTLTYKITGNLEGSLGLEKTNYQFDPGTLPFARPEERVYLTLDYERGPLDLLAKATWTGSQDLARFYDYANNPRYNLDGSKKQDKSPTFWTVDLRADYKFNQQWSSYVGVDNAFDYKQADHEGTLFVDGAGNIDVTHIWGPFRGRFLFGGIKFNL